METVRLETSRIVDWATFHEVCADTCGFPGFHGRNLDAWIDCMTYLDDGMSRFNLPPGEMLMIEVAGFENFQARLPEPARALTGCCALVNRRNADAGEPRGWRWCCSDPDSPHESSCPPSNPSRSVK